VSPMLEPRSASRVSTSSSSRMSSTSLSTPRRSSSSTPAHTMGSRASPKRWTRRYRASFQTPLLRGGTRAKLPASCPIVWMQLG
jgi:hypothetical protein